MTTPEPDATDAGAGDLWGEADDEHDTPSSGDASDEALDNADHDAVVAAVAASAPKNGRSLRLRPGAPSRRRARSGRGDRGGRKIVGLKIGASQLAAAVVHQIDGRSELVQAARVPLEPGIVVDGDVRDKVALAERAQVVLRGQRPSAQGRADRPGQQPDRRAHLRHRRDRRRGAVRQRRAVQGARGAAGRRPRVGARLPRDRRARQRERRVAPARARSSSRRATRSSRTSTSAGTPGLRLAGIDLEALGLLRAFVEPQSLVARTADDTATVVVSIGHESSTLLVAGGGACEFTRVFDWGGGALQEAIAQELDVHARRGGHDPPAPLALRHAEGARVPGRRGPSARPWTPFARELTPFARELVSSLQFYQTQPDSLGIGEIVITGGTSHLVGLADSLHQMIGVNVRVGDPLQRVVARTALDPALEATIGSLAVPIGLAIEDEALRSVNLLPSELRQLGRKKPDLVNDRAAGRGCRLDRRDRLPVLAGERRPSPIVSRSSTRCRRRSLRCRSRSGR